MLNKIHILGSSSAGNCYILHFTNKKIIQLDAGIENKDIEKVNQLYISHFHTDHYKEKFFKGYNTENLVVIKPIQQVDSGDIQSNFKRVLVPHKLLCNGYIINEDNEQIAYITDCGDWTKIDTDLSKCTYLFIECNWDKFLIDQGIIKPQPHAVYAFSKEGHMSNLDAINAISKWKVNKDCKIILIHKSQDHANYHSTYKMFESLPNKVAIAPREDGIIWCKAWTYTGDERGRIIK